MLRILDMNWSVPKLSRVLTASFMWIYRHYKDKLWLDYGMLRDEDRQVYWNECYRRRAMEICPDGQFCEDVVGFVDGTEFGIARPGNGDQRAYYSGWKRHHCLRWQGIMMPDGLLYSFMGPYRGESSRVLLLPTLPRPDAACDSLPSSFCFFLFLLVLVFFRRKQ